MDRTVASTLLIGGALAGVIIAALGLLEGGHELPPDAVARVNDVTIDVTQFDSYLTLVNDNSRTEKSRDEILQRIIDEELLVQRGVELGFLQLNSTVRNAIVQAVTRRFTTEDMGPVSNQDLETFYNANLSYFTPAEQFRVELLSQNVPLPDVAMTHRSLVDYLGPVVADHIRGLKAGDTSEIETGGEVFRLRLLERPGGEAPPFQNVRQIVEREYRRVQGEKAFNEYLVWLRGRAEIQTKDTGQ